MEIVDEKIQLPPKNCFFTLTEGACAILLTLDQKKLENSNFVATAWKTRKPSLTGTATPPDRPQRPKLLLLL